MALVVISCNGGKGDSPSSFYDSSNSEVVEEIEEVQDAEQKPALFYQRLLEQFCQRYYNDCFSGREYHFNSIIVDATTVVQSHLENGKIVSYEMRVDGRHSFEGFMKNHNDSPFFAFVDDLGDDSYVITFYIKRYGLFGEQLEETENATRTMSYSE